MNAHHKTFTQRVTTAGWRETLNEHFFPQVSSTIASERTGQYVPFQFMDGRGNGCELLIREILPVYAPAAAISALPFAAPKPPTL